MKKREIRQNLFKLDHKRRQILQPNLAKLGLYVGHGQGRILEFLLEKDGITQKELSEACSIDTATISRALDKLEEAGYIIRENHPESRRAFQIVLTEKGRNKAKEVDQLFREFDVVLCDGFSEKELEELNAYLRRIKNNLDSYRQENK